MTQQIYGEVENQTDLKKVFLAIRRDVDHAASREGLTELYRRAGYLIALTYAPSWQDKFGGKVVSLRRIGEEEFTRTVRRINRRAKAIGVEGKYDAKWGEDRAA